MRKKSRLALLLAGVMAFSAMTSGCGKKGETEETTTLAVTESTMINAVPDMSFENHDGEVLCDLTGEWIDEKFKDKRPLAMMINNVPDALPQYGISKADVIYEMQVEGGVTRMMAVFHDWSGIDKLMSIRSARHYFVYMAHYLDAIYGHYGWSPFAESAIPNLGVPNLNGLTNLGGVMYFRDPDRPSPHDVYTNSELIDEGIEIDGYDLKHRSDYEKPFAWNAADTPLNSGKTAKKVTTRMSGFTTPWFEYNEKDKTYYRFQYGEKHMDAGANEQLHYKNVICIYADTLCLDSEVGWLDILFEHGGTGYYITDGEYVPITFSYTDGTIKYYTEDGNQLKMNPGKTFISVLDSADQSAVTFE